MHLRLFHRLWNTKVQVEKSAKYICEYRKSTKWFRSNYTKGMEILSIYDIPFAIYSAKNFLFLFFCKGYVVAHLCGLL